MKSRSCANVGLGLGLVALIVMLAGPGKALAQGYGMGSSPGRAAYRPPGLWNDGPFYSAPHWDPWAPRAPISTSHVYTESLAPPYTTAPRGVYANTSPERGATYSYQQGFSPYSGYASWYQKTYGVQPNERNLAGAARAYFRSSPILADPRTLAPAVGQALYNPTPASAVSPLPLSRTTVVPSTPHVVTTPVVIQPRRVRGPVIYRGN